MEFPIGYRFQPTDTEVIVHYLSKKVMGKPLPYAIQELDVYEKEPWLIFDKNSRETFYVFTKLKKKKKDSRADRVVGCGTWKGQNCKEIKDDQDDKVIGYNRAFVFQENKRKCSSEFKGIAESNGHWIMHEFSLSDFCKIDKQAEEYVVCQIRNKDTDKIKNNDIDKEDDHGIITARGEGIDQSIGTSAAESVSNLSCVTNSIEDEVDWPDIYRDLNLKDICNLEELV